MKRMLWIGVAGLSLAGMVACGEKTEKRDAGPAVAVRTAAAAEQVLPSPQEYVGNIKSRQAVMISTKMMGRVVRIFVEEGQAVKRGQPLVEVDAAEAQSAYAQSKAGLDAADVAVRNAERDQERFKNLYEQKAVTKHQVEQVEMGLAAAKAQQAQAKANLQMSGALLSYGKIVAPDDGIITKKWMDAGNLAYPGAPILTLENPKQLELLVSVPEEKARQLAAGQQAQVAVDSLDKPIEVTVAAVVGASDPMSRTSLVKLALPDGSGFAPGQFARVRFGALSEKSLAVPVQAVVSQGQMDGVYVAEAGVARLRWIQVGQRTEQWAQVLSGLNVGDEVVVAVPPGLRDGSPVTASASN